MRRVKWFAFLLTVLVHAPTAHATIDLESTTIIYTELREEGVFDSFEFEIEVFGTGYSAGTVTPPGKSAQALGSDPQGLRLVSANFANFSALQSSFPTGIYQFSLDDDMGGFLNFSLNFAPVAPTGFPAITFPSDGQTGVALDPTYMWTCAGCVGNLLEMEVLNAAGNDVFSDDFVPGGGSWMPGALVGLANYTLAAQLDRTVNVSVNLAGDTFGFTSLYTHLDFVDFATVPEPSTALLAGFGLLGLLAATRRSRRGLARNEG